VKPPQQGWEGLKAEPWDHKTFPSLLESFVEKIRLSLIKLNAIGSLKHQSTAELVFS